MRNRFGGFRNRFDFFLRRCIPWGRPVRTSNATVRRELRLAGELEAFLAKFDWAQWTGCFSGSRRLRIADVGCRNFALGPAIERVFSRPEQPAWDLEVHGIEVDAYRRLHDLRTRRDYGNYFARQMKQATYHPIDFHAWREPVHILFLLNPFLTEKALSAWGLPRGYLRPEAMFQHAYDCLRTHRGILVLSHPTREEQVRGTALARAAGFTPVETRDWLPDSNSLQRQPRFGTLFIPTRAALCVSPAASGKISAIDPPSI